jgi:hypothetical protein
MFPREGMWCLGEGMHVGASPGVQSPCAIGPAKAGHEDPRFLFEVAAHYRIRALRRANMLQ